MHNFRQAPSQQRGRPDGSPQGTKTGFGARLAKPLIFGGPNWPQRTRERAFGFDCQSLFMPGQDHGNEDDDGEDHDPDRHTGRRCQSFYLRTQVIGAKGIDSDPRNGAGDVCNPEIAPGHVIGASQEADNAAKERDEAGKEDHFAAVAQEKILPDFDPRLAQ